MEKANELFEKTTKTVDELAQDLEKLSIRLNNLELELQASLNEDKLVEFVDPVSYHIC